jgi:hypothetical protein
VGGKKLAQAPARVCLEAAEAEVCEEEEEGEEEEKKDCGGPPPRVKRVIPLVIHHIWLGFINFFFHLFTRRRLSRSLFTTSG